MEISITPDTDTGFAACGMLLFGSAKVIGTLLWSPEISIIDYSKKEVDEWGNVTLTERGFAKLLSADVNVPTPLVGKVQKMLAAYRATPGLWIGSVDYESTVVYGFYRSFSVVIPNMSQSPMSLEVEGII